jgi:hypothetical protein
MREMNFFRSAQTIALSPSKYEGRAYDFRSW